MKRYFLFSIPVFALLVIWSCGRNGKDARTLITDRIQYDVLLKNADSTNDWWVQNMEGRSREAFVRLVMEKAYSGKLKTYNFLTLSLLSVEQTKATGSRTDKLSLQRSKPPYDMYDTLIKNELRMNDIQKIRFLEAWYWNENSNLMEKEILGICPLLNNYSETGEFRGYQPLFWISLTETFPLATGDKK
jgi:hypothetical protein